MLLMVSQKRGCVGQVPQCPLLTSQRDHFTPDRLTVTKAFKDQQNRMPRALKSHLRLEARANLDWPHSLHETTEDVNPASPFLAHLKYQPHQPSRSPPNVNVTGLMLRAEMKETLGFA